MDLILCEKPSVAVDIADAIGKFKKNNGFINVHDYCITWAFGHLLQIDEKNIPQKWELETLPILPDFYSYKLVDDKIKQFTIIKNLIKKAETVIIATDAGREGELIGRLIIEQAGWTAWDKTYRFWTSEALTPFVVRKELNNIKPINNYNSLYYSAIARQHSDFITGINFSRLFSIKSKTTCSLGRVQTPTLNAIVTRDKAIKLFKPQEYYLIKAIFTKKNIQFTGKLLVQGNDDDESKLNKEQAKTIFDDLKGTVSGQVFALNRQEKNEAPPLLHSLTSLQREANKIFGYTAQQTLDIAQKLYEKHKCISYPRTDSNYLADSEDSKKMVKHLLEKLDRQELSGNIEKKGKKVFDSSKLTDHHAVIPLAPYNGDDEKEDNIYALIERRFFGAFMSDYIFESTEALLKVKQYIFSAKGNKVIKLGWKDLYPDAESEVLPNLKEGEEIHILNFDNSKNFTKPPAFYNEASLLALMEKLNLGTPATRAGIIETLILREYVIRKKKNLLSTEKGQEIISLLDNSNIASPDMTGEWERQLDLIYINNTGEAGYIKFYNDNKLFVAKELSRLMGITVSENSTKQLTPKMLEIAKEIRDFWPQDLPVFVRMSVTDWVHQSGWCINDTISTSKKLSKLGIDNS